MTTETRTALNKCIDKLSEKVLALNTKEGDSVDILNASAKAVAYNEAIVILYNEIING